MIPQSYQLALPPGPSRAALPAPRIAGLLRHCAPSREAWLTSLVDAMRPVFASLDVRCPCTPKRKDPAPDCQYCDGTGQMRTEVPANVRVACSWPSKNARGASRIRIGECWHPRLSADGTYEMMISYAHQRPIDAAATLAHEVAHTVAGIAAQHNKHFGAVARAIGLDGKLTATHASPALIERLHDLIESKCGGYPGAPLGASVRFEGPIAGPDGGDPDDGPDSSGPRTQTCRQVLIACTECGVKLRGARGISDQGTGGIRALLPTPTARFNCPCGGEFKPAAPEQVWPEVNYLLAFLALIGTPGLEWKASSK